MGKGVSDIENFVCDVADDVCKSSNCAKQAGNEPVRLKTGFYRPKSAKTGDGDRLQKPVKPAGHPARDGAGGKIRAGFPVPPGA